MRPNIFVVVFDAARRDALEPYGAPVGSSPAIAQLARRGRALDPVYATSSWTVPSHASLFTGLLPRAAGASQVPSAEFAKGAMAPHRRRMLPAVMRDAGYATAAASANLWVSPVTGFDHGFDAFRKVDSDRNAQIHQDTIGERLRWLGEAVRGRVDDGARAIEASLSQWLTGRNGQPFFWFVNLLECHSPYLPPRPFAGGSVLTRLRAADDARKHYTLESIWRTCAGVETVPEPTLARLRQMYTASIAYMDDWLGRLLERLDGAGILDETLVVVLADHGESFGEDGLIAHGLSLGEQLTRVPFVCAGPHAEAVRLTSLADLPRVLAEAGGVKGHPYTDGPPAGFGLSQFDPLVDHDDEAGAQALAAMGIAGPAFERFTTPLTSAVANDLKVLRQGEAELIFDLRADPGERRPLAADELVGRGSELDLLRGALAHPSMRAVAPRSEPAEISAAEREELEERMRLLGYL